MHVSTATAALSVMC